EDRIRVEPCRGSVRKVVRDEVDAALPETGDLRRVVIRIEQTALRDEGRVGILYRTRGGWRWPFAGRCPRQRGAYAEGGISETGQRTGHSPRRGRMKLVHLRCQALDLGREMRDLVTASAQVSSVSTVLVRQALELLLARRELLPQSRAAFLQLRHGPAEPGY